MRQLHAFSSAKKKPLKLLKIQCFSGFKFIWQRARDSNPRGLIKILNFQSFFLSVSHMVTLKG